MFWGNDKVQGGACVWLKCNRRGNLQMKEDVFTLCSGVPRVLHLLEVSPSRGEHGRNTVMVAKRQSPGGQEKSDEVGK